MKTRVFSLRDELERTVSECATILKNGGLVAFPTETVYGLGADAFNCEAVSRIYDVKGRAGDNPLIFHVSGITMAETLAELTPAAGRAAGLFWPGPLTLVLQSRIGSEFTFGLGTVAVRMPDSIFALRIIEKLGRPLVAPSANLSGRPSPTKAVHVLEDFSGSIDAVIDGGETVCGLESTVIDMTGSPARLLRPGAITPGELTEAGIETVITGSEELLKRSPGTRYRHYAPRARVVLVRNSDDIRELAMRIRSSSAGFIGLAAPPAAFRETFVFRDTGEYARMLYAAFRHLDAEKVDVIIAQLPSEAGIGAAICDRLRRASAG